MVPLGNGKSSAQAPTEMRGTHCPVAPAPVPAAAHGLHQGQVELPGFKDMLPKERHWQNG